MILTNLQRSLISRTAMAVLGLSLLYGGYACIHAASAIYRDDLARDRQLSPHRYHTHTDTQNDASRLPFLIGIFLICVGLPFVLGAVLPNRVLYKLPFLSEPAAGREELEQMLR